MNTLLLSFNDLIAFLSELAMLGAYAWWGFSLKLSFALRVIVAIILVVIVTIIWGMFFAPMASIALAQPWNAVGEYVIFGIAGILLFSTGKRRLAIIYLVCALGSETVSFVWK